MNYLPLILAVLEIAPKVKDALNTGTSFKSVTKLITDPAVQTAFEQIGGALFPKVAPELRMIAGVVAAYNPDYTKWLQGSMNVILMLSPGLTVDGKYGPKTRAAVEILQAKLGLKVDGWAGDITSAAIQLALTKLPHA